jgi:hypothetical protein
MSEAKVEKKIGTLASYPAYYLDEDFISDKQGKQWNKEMNKRKRHGYKKNSRPNPFPPK